MNYKFPFKVKSLLLIIFSSIITLSCNNDSDSDSKESGKTKKSDNEYAESLCKCFEKLGIEDSDELEDLFTNRNAQRKVEDKAEKVLPKCLLKIAEEIEEEMDDMNKREKKKFIKSFMKSCIDTDCADIILGAIPYDMMGPGIKAAKNEMNRMDEYRNRDYYEDECGGDCGSDW